MSKNYIVNCYTCQHNGQETCKGCNTLLVGEDEPYQNWQLREDLEQKDKRITELEQELAELKEKDNYHLRYELAGADETITNLKKQIEENGKEINTKNNKLAELKKELTICKDTLRRKTQSNRDLQHRVHNVNTQLAIQELEKVKNGIKHFCDIHSDEYYGVKSQVKGIEQDVCEEIDNQIKNLENL